MLSITSHAVEVLEDPFGILPGDRYEFILNLDVPEDDELYSDKGVYLRVIYTVEDGQSRISQYQFFEKETDKYFDFELDEDEEAMAASYCLAHLPSSEEADVIE
ncbi:DUF6509 family protein [Metabacillus sp. GX 13764]|uniref:DUF6509 family protein n=1 Tax=Metabacillus kandeliae TaxID=2900151 RepID=UPI001E3ABA52|nr:DUF6509 family protein [Metabacillus kandeliae]MCD7035610.1 DUF6509 family protein [Metabacillus kandeliae]